MNGVTETCITVDAEVLVKIFLKVLNQENLINNKTYLAAVDKLEKGDKRGYVD